MQLPRARDACHSAANDDDCLLARIVARAEMEAGEGEGGMRARLEIAKVDVAVADKELVDGTQEIVVFVIVAVILFHTHRFLKGQRKARVLKPETKDAVADVEIHRQLQIP